MSGHRRMLLPDRPAVRRLVTIIEEDWDLMGDAFDEMQFRSMLVGALVNNYCQWLKSQGVVSKETREASGLSIEDFINQTKKFKHND